MNGKDGIAQAALQRPFRTAMGTYPTGVAVVALRHADWGVIGLTINSFSSVSLQPLLVSWNLGNGSQWLPAFMRSAHYSVNVLAAGQVHLARQFARHDRVCNGAASWTFDSGGVPLLEGAVAHFSCHNLQQHGAGDHTLFVGRVEAFDCHPERPPLLFHDGCYHDGRVLQAGRRP